MDGVYCEHCLRRAISRRIGIRRLRSKADPPPTLTVQWSSWAEWPAACWRRLGKSPVASFADRTAHSFDSDPSQSADALVSSSRKEPYAANHAGKRALWRERAKHRREIAPAFEVWRLDNNVNGRNRGELVVRGSYDRAHDPDDRAWIGLIAINWFARQMIVVDVFPVTVPTPA